VTRTPDWRAIFFSSLVLAVSKNKVERAQQKEQDGEKEALKSRSSSSYWPGFKFGSLVTFLHHFSIHKLVRARRIRVAMPSAVAQLNGLTSLTVYASRLPHSQPTHVHWFSLWLIREGCSWFLPTNLWMSICENKGMELRGSLEIWPQKLDQNLYWIQTVSAIRARLLCAALRAQGRLASEGKPEQGVL